MALSGNQITGLGPTHAQGAYAGFVAKAESVVVIAHIVATISVNAIIDAKRDIRAIIEATQNLIGTAQQ